MKTASKEPVKGTNGTATPKDKEALKAAKIETKDTVSGAETATTTLKVEKEPKQVSEIIEAIRKKAKLVSDLQTTIDRRQQLQKLYSEEKLKITIKPIDYTGRREDLEFFNENIIDYIVKMLVEKSKEVENEIALQLFELEK